MPPYVVAGINSRFTDFADFSTFVGGFVGLFIVDYTIFLWFSAGFQGISGVIVRVG